MPSQKSIARSLVKTVCAGTLLHLSSPAQAIGMEEKLAQLNAYASLSSEVALDSLLENMESDSGVIKIPIKKQPMQVSLPQLRADIESAINNEALAEDADGIILTQKGGKQRMQVRETLENQNNMVYMGDLYIGSPAQAIRAIFDTGSANPWILSKTARAEHSFDQTKSTTFKDPSTKQWTSIHFGSGTLRGYFASDTVLLGDPQNTEHALTLPSWNFGLVTENSVFDKSFDAIIGMAYKEFAEEGVTPFFEALRSSGKLAKEMHSWYLSLNPDDQSEIMMGGWNEDRFRKELLVWHPVVNKRFWAVKLDDIKVNGVSTGFCTRTGANCTIAPDSGTSLLTFPQKALTEFNQQYGDSVDCSESEFTSFPDLVYVIRGVEYRVPPHHWIDRTVSKADSTQGTCKSNVKSLDTEYEGIEEMFILGDAFMQLFYTIHDAEHDRVGFAPAIHNHTEVLKVYDTAGQLVSVKEVKSKGL